MTARHAVVGARALEFGMLRAMIWALAAGMAISCAVVCRADLPPAFSDLTLDAATKQVEGTDKLVLMKFTADWCMPCKAMDQTTWRDDKVVAWVKEHGVAIQVDVDKEPKISQRYQVAAMPTMVMIKGGNEIARQTGYMDAGRTFKWLEDASAGKLVGGPKVDKTSRDMQARLQTARELAMGGKPDEATEEFVWLWDHMVEIDPSTMAVRGSFMASDMTNLAARHEPAKVAFTKLRDATAEKLKSSNPGAELRDDWIVLNEVVGDEDATLAWFDSVKGNAKDAAQLERVSFRIVNLLIAQDRLADVPLLYPDPMHEVRLDYAMSAEMAKQQRPLPEFLDTASKEAIREQPWTAFREKVAILYAGNLAAGKEEAAAEIMAEARKLYDKPKLITGVLGFALSRGQARPAMRALLDDAEQAGADVKTLRVQLDAGLSGK